MSVEDVIEASRKVLSPAVEAALLEAGGRFQLNSRTLEQLADSGVSPNVIDLMVAQAYPDRFEIDRPSLYPSAPLSAGTSAGSSVSGTTIIMGSSGYPYPYYDPFFNSYYYYSPFAYPYYWGSTYFPYRYGYYGYGYRNYNYNNYYYGYPGSIYVPGGGSRPIAQPGSPDSPGTGAAIATPRGYTRVRPAGSSSDDTGGSSTAGERSVPVRGVRGVSRGSDSGSSGGGSVSSGGYSSGGGSSSSSGSSGAGSAGGGNSGGGRTAQPR
jgi:hypothetical protein